MNVFLAILGALLCGGISGGAAYFVSKRSKEHTDVAEELSKLQAELEGVRSHAARIQQALEQKVIEPKGH